MNVLLGSATTPRSREVLTPRNADDVFKVPAPKKKIAKQADLSAVDALLSFTTPPASPSNSPAQVQRRLASSDEAMVGVTKNLYHQSRKRGNDASQKKKLKKLRIENGDAVVTEEVLEVIAEDKESLEDEVTKTKQRAFFNLCNKISQPEVFTPELQRIGVIAFTLFASVIDIKKKANLIKSFFENVFCAKLNMSAELWAQLLTSTTKPTVLSLIARAVIVHANEDLVTNQFRLLSWRHIYIYTSNFNTWLSTIVTQHKSYLSAFPDIILANYAYVEELEHPDNFLSLIVPLQYFTSYAPKSEGKVRLVASKLPARILPNDIPSSEEVIFKVM